MPWLSTITQLAPYAIDLGKLAVSALPHLGQRKSDPTESPVSPALRQEILELQAAATQNAEDIRKMASDLSSALIALEDAGKSIEVRFRRLGILAFATSAVSIVAIIFAVAAWVQ